MFQFVYIHICIQLDISAYQSDVCIFSFLLYLIHTMIILTNTHMYICMYSFIYAIDLSENNYK